MNVYDFDDTILNGDCSKRIYFFCLRRNPQILLYLPIQIIGIALFILKIISKEKMKSLFFSFFKSIKNIDKLADDFCEKNFKDVMPWYLKQKQETDLVISASPYFLISRFCKRLGIQNPICTNMDTHTGEILGTNCKEGEKVVRFRKAFPGAQIEKFYSDSMSDLPLAKIAQEAFLVDNKKGSMICFPQTKNARSSI